MKYEEIVKQKIENIKQKVKEGKDVLVLSIESSCDDRCEKW